MAQGRRAATDGKRHRGRARWLILAGAVVFCAGVLFLLFQTEPVEVTQSHLELGGGQVFIAGRVHNRGDVTRAVKLELHYYDREGHALGLDTLSFDNLPPGATQSFRGPAHEAGTIADYSIYLNEGRNPYGN
ncbi:MAG TPA: FxLYD domain-containing protein [Candidatus Binataceae bacterium]|nr:FxLYD domain-containing protein [Candidatus Binataceae bacterium]